MGKFKLTNTAIEELYIVEPIIYEDNRGYFMETYNKIEFKSIGINDNFVQDNQSKSKKGVLRGLHFQLRYPQAKLVRVVKGKVFDVAVDLRENSDTYGKWYSVVLSQQNNKQFYIPKGFAHGFLVLSDEVEFVYKCSDYYHPEDQQGIIWNDSTINIKWPLDKVEEIILSSKDKIWPTLKQRG